MATTTPTFAIVRPRVVVTRTGESRLLDDVVAEIAEEYGSGLVRLCGPGSGKSTALAHLAAVFSHEESITFLDEPTPQQLEACSSDCITIAAMPSGGGRNLELALEPWGIDELIEYLLARHHDACGSVMDRLGPAARFHWLPAIAAVVLDRFVVDSSLSNPVDALIQYVDSVLPKPKQKLAAAEFCVAMLIGSGNRIESAVAKLSNAKIPSVAKNLLRHEMVQLPLAAERIRGNIFNGYFGDLQQRLPRKLVKLLGRRCADTPQTINQLMRLLGSRRTESHAMAASIVLAADPSWRPQFHKMPYLAGGIFVDANWSGINLSSATLFGCDFNNANLESAALEGACLNNAYLDGARLVAASLGRVRATGASFHGALLQQAKFDSATLIKAQFVEASLGEATLAGADLTGANFSSAHLQRAILSNSRFRGAIFDDVDLTGAVLRAADLAGVDLRRAVLDGACLADANLKAVQLENVHAENVQMPGAILIGAHLTGSSFPATDLRKADLTGALLAEIDWENADLRGANLREVTFHMGSSRSGLVGSPYACEGSKTGFYTDDFEDLSFKRPEEVRKANLCGADLRGVRAEAVDFYLVDLRGAKLDPALMEQARASGAILENFER